MQIAILGRQPKISLAELECLFGANAITEVADYAALIDREEPLPQERLGGTIKSAKLLNRLQKTNLEGAFAYLQKSIPDHLQYLPDGKLQLGVSVYGFKAQKNWLLRQTLALKKIVKKSGRSVRIIENKSEALEAAQVLYNKLTSPLGWEILLIKDGKDVLVAQTSGVQNIDDYAKRDFERPKRDTYVGMLPPKLAQIIINLGVGNWKLEEKHPAILLDPFCGTGVIPQEALVMGYDVIATDLEPRMVDYTRENLDWLTATFQVTNSKFQLEQADATTHSWDFSKFQPSDSKLYVACETYLGKPLTSLPNENELQKITNEANQIATGFLQNIAPQLQSGTRLCLALPAWNLRNGQFKQLEVLDHLTDLGYNRVDLKHATKNDLIYHRPDQVVARQLTILEKK